jgi:bifunctional non-homologous end joining protein LigD
MLAKSGVLPDNDALFAYEFKWDGMRAMVSIDHGKIQIWSRAGRDFTAHYPELQALRLIGRRCLVLDGEIVALGEDARPDFGLLQRRMGGKHASIHAASTPVTFMAFDLLQLGGRDFTTQPYNARRQRLRDLGLAGEHWQTPEHHMGCGADIQRVSRGHRLEGIVAKRLDSRYESGLRTGAWIKIKNFITRTFQIGGWIPNDNGGIEALLVGKRASAGRLAYAGAVELGALWPLKEPLKHVERNEKSLPCFRIAACQVRGSATVCAGEVYRRRAGIAARHAGECPTVMLTTIAAVADRNTQ